MRILVIEDEARLAQTLAELLHRQGYTADISGDGLSGLDNAASDIYDLVVLDAMLPGMDGFTLLQRLRQEGHTVPVLMLTAKGTEYDKVLGLDQGADDYIAKPFHPQELVARVRSQLRRYFQLGGGALRPEVLTLGTIQMDDREKTVAVDGDPVALTPTEYDILKLLLEHPGQVFSPREIYRKVWKDAPFGSENTVAVHIRHLREKIEIDPAEPRYLKVVWGQGYKLEKGMRT